MDMDIKMDRSPNGPLVVSLRVQIADGKTEFITWVGDRADWRAEVDGYRHACGRARHD